MPTSHASLNGKIYGTAGLTPFRLGISIRTLRNKLKEYGDGSDDSERNQISGRKP